MTYNKFYFSVAKDVTQMTQSELELEHDSALTSEQTSKIYQQGISSKEMVRTRLVRAEKWRREHDVMKNITNDEELMKIIASAIL